MQSNNANWNTAKMSANNGVDYCGAETLTPAKYAGSERWFGFWVNAECSVSALTLKDKNGTTISFTPTWVGKTLSAGAYISFGIYQNEPLYCTSITNDSGSIILLLD